MQKVLIISSTITDETEYSDILHEFEPYQLVLFCSKKITHNEVKKRKKLYDKIHIFENYSMPSFDVHAINLNKTFNFTRIVAISEGDLIRAASLRDLFQLDGQNYQSAMAFRNKYLMKNHVQNYGLEVPAFALVKTACGIYSFAKEYGLPIVVKPVHGANSVQVRVLNSCKEIDEYLLENDPFGVENRDLLIESYVSGAMYHVNGIIWNHKVAVMWPSKYLHPCVDFIGGKPYGDYLLPTDYPLNSRLFELTHKVVQALPDPKGAVFHLEVFHTPDDRLVFCEIAARTCGGYLNYAWRHYLNIDLKREHIRMQAGLGISPHILNKKVAPSKLCMELKYPPRPQTLNKLLTDKPFDWVSRCEYEYSEGDKGKSPEKLSDYFASFMFFGETEQELLSKTRDLDKWINENSHWR